MDQQQSLEYEDTRKYFIDYMRKNEPPYYLSLQLVGNKVWLWHAMLDEFCPIELWYRHYIDLPKRVWELDSNKDYIYGWGDNTRHRGTYIYRISSEPIAVLLRLASD